MAARQRFCPCCSSPFTPHTSTVRVVGGGRLRRCRRRAQLRGNQIGWLHSPLGSSRRKLYTVVHCKICKKSFVGGVSARHPGATETSQTGSPGAVQSAGKKGRGQKSLSTPQSGRKGGGHTPSPHSSRKKSSSQWHTLRSMLHQSSIARQQQQQLSASPKLSDFLSQLH